MKLFDKPKLLANWILGDVSSKLNQANITLKDSLISPEHLVELLKRIEDKTISNKIAKEVFEEIFEGKGNADSIIKEKGLSQISDAKFLEELVSKVISDNPNMVEDYINCLLYTSPSPRDGLLSRMPSSA